MKLKVIRIVYLSYLERDQFLTVMLKQNEHQKKKTFSDTKKKMGLKIETYIFVLLNIIIVKVECKKICYTQTIKACNKNI